VLSLGRQLQLEIRGSGGAQTANLNLESDGGGIRGLSEIIILHEIMARLRTDPNQEIPRPCDYFDLICGTSTGGYG
jgi:patatin-like phospholipase/acyl hydrolase